MRTISLPASSVQSDPSADELLSDAFIRTSSERYENALAIHEQAEADFAAQACDEVSLEMDQFQAESALMQLADRHGEDAMFNAFVAVNTKLSERRIAEARKATSAFIDGLSQWLLA